MKVHTVVVNLHHMGVRIEEFKPLAAILDAHVLTDTSDGKNAIAGGECEPAVFSGDGDVDPALFHRGYTMFEAVLHKCHQQHRRDHETVILNVNIHGHSCHSVQAQGLQVDILAYVADLIGECDEVVP